LKGPYIMNYKKIVAAPTREEFTAQQETISALQKRLATTEQALKQSKAQKAKVEKSLQDVSTSLKRLVAQYKILQATHKTDTATIQSLTATQAQQGQMQDILPQLQNALNASIAKYEAAAASLEKTRQEELQTKGETSTFVARIEQEYAEKLQADLQARKAELNILRDNATILLKLIGTEDSDNPTKAAPATPQLVKGVRSLVSDVDALLGKDASTHNLADTYYAASPERDGRQTPPLDPEAAARQKTLAERLAAAGETEESRDEDDSFLADTQADIDTAKQTAEAAKTALGNQ
jgi:hypothetical protein